MNGHPWTCVCDACLAEDVRLVAQSKMGERLGALASEVLRLRSLLRDSADEACRLAGDPEPGSVVAELVDVARAAALQDTDHGAHGKSALSEVTFYLEGEDAEAIIVRASPPVLRRVMERAGRVDEVRIDLPDGSHWTWPVAR
jgi:hypothetical protein